MSGTQVLKENILVPHTGGLNSWKFIEVPDVRLETGVNAIRVVVKEGGFNFSEISFSKK